MQSRILLFVALFAVVLTSKAVVLLEEPFDYANGPLVTVSEGAWLTHSGVTGQVEVLNGRVDLSAPQSEDVNRLLAGQPYAATTNTVLYASFTVNFFALPSAAGEYFVHFKDNTAVNFRCKVFALTTGAASGHLRIGIANGANSPAVALSTNLALNTDYRVVIRYAISNVSATLWINPESEASPSVTAADPAIARAVTAFAMRQNTGIGIVGLDELRVGTTFGDVIAPPPVNQPVITQSPVDAAVVEGGTAVFAVSVTGSEPFHYQWQFNNTNLPSATNASLIIEDAAVANAGTYRVQVTNAAGSVFSDAATLTVVLPSEGGTVSLVTLNAKGNFATDWSTNAPQVQAIARQLRHLNADIITLNEIPNGQRHEMTNWMTAFFPGYQLAVSSGTDGVLRSGVISRFPIARTQSWLDGVELTEFGYDGTFTRDLFEAELVVPGATEPFHVFTTHLKSGSDGDSQDRRAAEASAISNFFVNVFIPTNGTRPYVLTGDMNEDIYSPPSANTRKPIQRLIAPPTGLELTTPLNPYSLSSLTFSIQSSNGLSKRYDYALPAGVLANNIVGSEVFRSDLLPVPPPPLLTTDSATASDHLPVMLVFSYPDPVLRVTATLSNETLWLEWPSLIGRKFVVQSSTNLTQWTLSASNITATSGRQTWPAPAGLSNAFYRVVRVP